VENEESSVFGDQEKELETTDFGTTFLLALYFIRNSIRKSFFERQI